VCNHQDHAGVGTAIPDALHRWRVAQMQDMGANAWRSAHNPPSQALLDICDEAGMMMMAETRLNTTSPEAMDELERMILSSRNHPSIILWSVGNEEGHQGTPRGRNISARLAARCRNWTPRARRRRPWTMAGMRMALRVRSMWWASTIAPTRSLLLRPNIPTRR
jgi:beta-galactosidase